LNLDGRSGYKFYKREDFEDKKVEK
jgi:hypothetical protein